MQASIECLQRSHFLLCCKIKIVCKGYMTLPLQQQLHCACVHVATRKRGINMAILSFVNIISAFKSQQHAFNKVDKCAWA